jgi:pilus assembly protein Flp/PilA
MKGAVAMKKLMELVKREDGVTSSEYALIAALIAVVIITGVRALGANLSTSFTRIAAAVGQ